MKNKFSALIAALIFTSPLSYAAEKIKTNDIKEFSNVDIDRLSKIYFDNKKITQTDDNICNDFGHIDYDLWGVSNDAIDFYKIEREAKQKSIVENLKRIQMLEAIKKRQIEEEKILETSKKLRQIKLLSKYGQDALVIDFIDGFDPYIHNYLKKFIKNPTVKHFKDYLGRDYYNISLQYIVSRFGNLGFGSDLVYLGNEYNSKLRPILGNITITYARYFPPKSQQITNNVYAQLDEIESLIEKTKFAHFVEDVIVKPLYDDDRKDFYNYKKLIALFVFLAQDDKYRTLIFNDWENYLNNKESSQWAELLSENSEIKSKIMNDVKKFINKILCAKRNYFSKHDNNKK